MGNTFSRENETRLEEVHLFANQWKQRLEHDKKSVDLEHQQKIAELIKEMELAKFQAGHELFRLYIQTLSSIIQQNSTIFERAVPLIQLIRNEETPKSVKKAAETAIAKAFDV